jgi:hypothetical protein
MKITTVRMAVARLDETFWTPTFARIAVTPAKRAESSAQKNHKTWDREAENTLKLLRAN